MAQLPTPKPLKVEPNSYGFSQLPVGGTAFTEFRVCKPVPDSLLGGTTIGSSIGNHILSQTSSGPFTIVAGKTLDLRQKECETVRIQFRPTVPGGFFAWLKFSVQESPLQPGNRKLFESYALVTGGAVRAEGIFFVDASVTGSGGISGPDLRCPDRCRAEYPRGTRVTFTAVPGGRSGASYPYHRAWGGACAGQVGRECTVTITADTTIQAQFGAFSPPPAPYVQLTVQVNGNGQVQLEPGVICKGPNGLCTRGYRVGTTLTLGAIGAVFFLPNIVQKPFEGWGGACQGTNETCTLSLGGNTTVVASFGPGTTPLRRLLTVSSIEGEGRVAGSGIDCPGDCGEKHSQSSVVSLSAQPAAGWTFGGWGWGGACAGQGNPCTLTMSTSNAVSATFRPALGWPGAPGAPTSSLKLLVSTGGSASGSGLDCPPTCSADLPAGSTATIAGVPSPPHRFVGWTGSCGGQGNPCRLAMTRNHQTTALFALPEYRLSVAVSGSGRLSVGDQPSLQGCCSHHGGVCGCGGDFVVCCDQTFSPTCSCTEINCPGDCGEVYPAGTRATIHAAPNKGWRFSHWTGACAGQGNPCTLVMSSDLSTTAVFSR